MDNKDFAALAICAIRYCFGRQTYMPELIRGIIRNNIDKIDTQTLKIMERDCKFQKDVNLYGDERIDKPGWLAWHEYLQTELQKRRIIDKSYEVQTLVQKIIKTERGD